MSVQEHAVVPPGSPDAARCPSPTSKAPFNISSYLPRIAASAPDRAAVVVTASRDGAGRPRYRSVSFAELEFLSNRNAGGLSDVGLARGERVLLMVRPGIEFLALTFALFKIGAVPVMIDPGMGVRRLLECAEQVDLGGFIGIPAAQLVRLARPGPFRNVRHCVTVGRRWGWSGVTLPELQSRGTDRFTPVETACDETAAILFTSGSTGPAKGVVYEHGMFGAQVEAIRTCYGMAPGEVDLPAFPLFALFSAAMGMTSVIPDMDASRPARVDPAKIVTAVLDQRVTTTFGSPAMWRRVAAHCVERGVRLPTLRRVLVAGAPVPPGVIEDLHRVLGPDADVHTPYGATESLPVSSIGGRELVSDCIERSRVGAGTCVGRTLPGVELRVIRVSDEPIPVWDDRLLVPGGAIGEFVVAGPMVTKAYFGLPAATAGAKISDGDRIWHRIGDVGYRDADGRLWFCGHKAHRVTTADGVMYSVPCEAVFNAHPRVCRSALVGVGPGGAQRPVMIVEPTAGPFPRRSERVRFRRELLDLGRANVLTRSIDDIVFHPAFPVDVRHNAKINREQLAVWAARRVP